MSKKKYRILLGNKEILTTNSINKALTYILEQYLQTKEENLNLEKSIDGNWDEWIDEEGQSVYEYLYAYNNNLSHLEEQEENKTEFFIDENDYTDDDDDSFVTAEEELMSNLSTENDNLDDDEKLLNELVSEDENSDDNNKDLEDGEELDDEHKI